MSLPLLGRRVGQSAVAGPQTGVDSDLPPAADVLATRGAEVQALLDARRADRPPVGLATPLSAAYLAWRYGRGSGLDYRAVAFEGDDAAARAAGYLQVPRTGLLLVTRPLRPLPVDPTLLSSWQVGLGELEVF